jgi:hypothetical protein
MSGYQIFGEIEEYLRTVSMTILRPIFNFRIGQTDVDQNLAYHYTMRDSVTAVLMPYDCHFDCLDRDFAS